jgi:hypothetical protein
MGPIVIDRDHDRIGELLLLSGFVLSYRDRSGQRRLLRGEETMNHRCIVACLLTACGVLFGLTTADAQQSLQIQGPSAPLQGLGSAQFDILMSTTAPTEGFVLAVGHGPELLVQDISVTGTATEAAGAELVVPETLSGGWTLGVVLDSGPPFNAQTIPAGTNLLIATVEASSTVILGQGDPDITAAMTFVDGTLNNPPLDNILVQGGLSLGAGQGLGLDDAAGTATITAPPPDSLSIESGSAPADGEGATGCARILLNNQSGSVQGYTLAISHDPSAITLEEINTNGTIAELLGIEFEVANLYNGSGGGSLGVVLDFTSPFDGQAIPTGSENHIANYCYSCNNPMIYFTGQDAPMAMTSDLTFVDGVLGTPPLTNVIVVGGQSINPAQNNGTFTCEPVEVPLEDTKFSCGPRSYENTVDPTNNPAPPIEGTIGTEVEVCFFYCDSDDNIQGVQLAVTYDCNLTMLDFSITDSIFDEVGAEFFSYSIDDDDEPGDGCEFIAGILLDALPPFEDQTVPQTSVPLIIGCGTFFIDEADTCGTDLSIDFTDGVNAAQSLPTKNIAVIEYQSIQNFQMDGCVVRVVPDELFQRGDCNSDDKVDLADAATVLGWQFQGEAIECPDACDANDDGKINLADSVLLMNYLFLGGSAPPAPGPLEDGIDPTVDELPLCVSNDTYCL